MDEYTAGQQEFNLPHDVVQLPSGGIFYKSKKKSVKVGYLTATDENVISNIDSKKTIKESIVLPLLRNRLYEKDLRPEDLVESDIEAILIFLRNTSFGPEYKISINDPETGKRFSADILLDELDFRKPSTDPNEDGTFDVVLPKSQANVKLKPLLYKEIQEISKAADSYPAGRVAPRVTMKLQKQIVSVNGDTTPSTIIKFVEGLPIMDSKFIRKFIDENEPRLDLTKTVIAPSGNKVDVEIAFGVEFFRVFF
jgi:hypothetical protein